MLARLKRIFTYRYYYLEVFSRRLNGKANMDPRTNGEFDLLSALVARNTAVRVLDIGANVGDYTKAALGYARDGAFRIHAVEPMSSTYAHLTSVIDDPRATFGNYAVADTEGEAEFYFDTTVNDCSGSNSIYKHYYLNSGSEKVTVKTIDGLMAELGWPKVNLVKLDIEGAEVPALKGAKKALEAKAIEAVQLEYNQTWLKAGGSIEEVFKICQRYGYELFRISKSGLIPIPSYHYMLDDFYFQNLLMLSDELAPPMPVREKALPFI